jgi:hypothetical protein
MDIQTLKTLVVFQNGDQVPANSKSKALTALWTCKCHLPSSNRRLFESDYCLQNRNNSHEEAEINVYIELVEKYGGPLAKKWGPDILHVIVATQPSSFFKNVCLFSGSDFASSCINWSPRNQMSCPILGPKKLLLLSLTW